MFTTSVNYFLIHGGVVSFVWVSEVPKVAVQERLRSHGGTTSSSAFGNAGVAVFVTRRQGGTTSTCCDCCTCGGALGDGVIGPNCLGTAVGRGELGLVGMRLGCELICGFNGDRLRDVDPDALRALCRRRIAASAALRRCSHAASASLSSRAGSSTA